MGDFEQYQCESEESCTQYITDVSFTNRPNWALFPLTAIAIPTTIAAMSTDSTTREMMVRIFAPYSDIPSYDSFVVDARLHLFVVECPDVACLDRFVQIFTGFRVYGLKASFGGDVRFSQCVRFRDFDVVSDDFVSDDFEGYALDFDVCPDVGHIHQNRHFRSLCPFSPARS